MITSKTSPWHQTAADGTWLTSELEKWARRMELALMAANQEQGTAASGRCLPCLPPTSFADWESRHHKDTSLTSRCFHSNEVELISVKLFTEQHATISIQVLLWSLNCEPITPFNLIYLANSLLQCTVWRWFEIYIYIYIWHYLFQSIGMLNFPDGKMTGITDLDIWITAIYIFNTLIIKAFLYQIKLTANARTRSSLCWSAVGNHEPIFVPNLHTSPKQRQCGSWQFFHGIFA